MPIAVDDVMKLLCSVSQKRQMKAAVKHSGRGALVAGTVAFVGGLVGGPPGIALGAAVNQILMVWEELADTCNAVQWCQGKSSARLQKLVNEAKAVIGNLDWTDTVQLTALVMSNQAMQQKLLTVLATYITKELQAEIRYDD
ncbi:Uncharacterized protein C19orf12-like [Cricetulus griseus]|uniref:Uncharacterized protein C19orf12-like n=1 Tax=Cricetulus griseus TaxID=10029 RepID=G3I4C3_CRIGR|nr:Uncharacterized protein C19orf12-like [Cricetulus griseus]